MLVFAFPTTAAHFAFFGAVRGAAWAAQATLAAAHVVVALLPARSLALAATHGARSPTTPLPRGVRFELLGADAAPPCRRGEEAVAKPAGSSAADGDGTAPPPSSASGATPRAPPSAVGATYLRLRVESCSPAHVLGAAYGPALAQLARAFLHPAALARVALLVIALPPWRASLRASATPSPQRRARRAPLGGPP